MGLCYWQAVGLQAGHCFGQHFDLGFLHFILKHFVVVHAEYRFRRYFDLGLVHFLLLYSLVQVVFRLADYKAVVMANCFLQNYWDDFRQEYFAAAKLAGLIVGEPFIFQL